MRINRERVLVHYTRDFSLMLSIQKYQQQLFSIRMLVLFLRTISSYMI